MECSAVKCLDSSPNACLFACYGPCGKFYHAKCVGSTTLFIEKVDASKIAVWFCPDCRKISLSQLAFKMSSFKTDITKIKKGLDELCNNFNDAVSNLNNFSAPKFSVDISTSTDDLEEPHTPLPNVSSKTIDLLVQSTSDISKHNKSKKKKQDTHSSEKRLCLRSCVGPTNNNNETTTVDLAVVSSRPSSVDNQITELPHIPKQVESVPETINVNYPPIEPFPIPKQVESVPKPKQIFVSRLKPDLTSNDIISHLTLNHNISNDLIIRCTKISKPNSFVSSFKMFVPPSQFDYLCSPNFWPSGTLLKEFVGSSKKKRVENSTVNNVSKN